MKSIFTVLVLVLCLFTVKSQAQNIRLYASPRGNADVLDANKDTLLNPWCGGWLNPEFSNIDLNGDGLLDLFVFLPGVSTYEFGNDNRVLTFINLGNGQYQYAPDYESYFPPLRDWALLVDYNKDGKPDIFTYAEAGSGIDVFENISDAGGLKFKRVTPIGGQLGYSYGSFMTQIFSTPTTIPAIADIDGDGDIDIIEFDPEYQTAHYFQNNAVEKGESLDSLDFTSPACAWGGFATWYGFTVDSTVKIHAASAWSPFGCGAAMNQNEHGASTMLAIDMDNDGDMDMLYGNMYNSFIVQMTNGRIESGVVKNKHDTIVALDSAFIGDSHKVNVPLFPAAYLADGTSDNLPDLITAPFLDTGTVADHKTYLYRNTGEQGPGNHFEFVTDNFLQETMLDYGEHAAPAFLDYNNDSLMDLVIGTRANPTGGYTSPNFPFVIQPPGYGDGNPNAYDHLELYKNIGSKDKAVYEKVDDDFGSLKRFKLTFLAPTFADLDGDGRPDMFIGSTSGKVMYFKNMSDSENTIQWKLISDSLPNIQSGEYSAPCLAHISSDSLYDLLLGGDTGTIGYYKNIGSKKSPQFKLITNSFGKINLNYYYLWPWHYDSNGNPIDSMIYENYSRSFPTIADLDHNGKQDLVVGSTGGEMYFYFNITDNINGPFVRTDTVIYNTLKHAKEDKKLGSYAMPAAADLDNDGLPELLVGNYVGGIQYFGSKQVTLTKLHNSAVQAPPSFSSMFSLYPNPAKDKVVLQYYNALQPQNAEVNIIDVMGKTVTANSFLMVPGTGKQQISTMGFAPGVYFVSITTNDHYYSGGKLVITR